MPVPPRSAAKAAILEAAAAHFVHQGYEGTSMEQIRAAAEVSNGSLYHFFPTKADLVRAVYADALRDFQSGLHAVLAGDPPGEAGVRGLLEATFRWILKRPDYARLLHTLRRTDAVLQGYEEIAGLNAEAFGALGQWIAACIARGEMRKLSLDVWMALVFAPVVWLVPAWLESDRPSVPAGARKALVEGAWAAVAPLP